MSVAMLCAGYTILKAFYSIILGHNDNILLNVNVSVALRQPDFKSIYCKEALY